MRMLALAVACLAAVTTAQKSSHTANEGGTLLSSERGSCEYSADSPTVANNNTTCEQFPSSGDLTVQSTAPKAAGSFGVDTRTMVYSEPPALDFTKHRRIVACAMSVGWASAACGKKVSCALGRLSTIGKFWEMAGARKCDIALLPEDFFGYTTLPVERYTALLGPIAKKYGMYVAAGMHAYPADYNMSIYHKTSDPDNKIGYNTALLVGRKGEYIGEYHKQFPVGVPGDGWPGRGGTVVFDLDFGRVAILTCFDMNFQESWMSAYAQGVDVVLWPSAYGGGLNMRAYAALFGLRIIPAGIGDITDITGRVAEGLNCDCDGIWQDYGGDDNSGYCPGCQSPSACVCSADLDLDMTLIHSDQGGMAGGRADQMIAKYGGGGLIEDVFVPEYCMRKGKCAAHGDLVQQSNNRLLRLTAKGYENKTASVRQALADAGLPTVRHYAQRARFAVNKARMEGRASAQLASLASDNLAIHRRQELSGLKRPFHRTFDPPSRVGTLEREVARLERELARARAELASARAAE